VIDTNITGTIYLIYDVGNDMRARGRGRILITGFMARVLPGMYQAVYNGTKAFLDSFLCALRAELKDSGVTVTCLMPGAAETGFFAGADMLGTKLGGQKQDDPVELARIAYEAMQRGDGDVADGWTTGLRSAMASVPPSAALAGQRRMAGAPSSDEHR